MNARLNIATLGSLLLLVFATLSSALNAHAQDAGPQTRAARMTVVQGSVTVNEPGGNGTGNSAIPGQVNLPLLSGVQVMTGNDGQAEIEFEDGSVVRLTPNSVLSLDNLAIGSDGIFVTDMSLLRGLAYCELRATQQYSFVVNAGGDMLSPVENTTVRVNFDQPPASFAVLDGTAQVERQSGAGGGYQAQVRAGETLQADPADTSRYFLSQDIAADSWDQWNDDLDQAAVSASAASTSVRDSYAGADGYGWSDLDANGSWYNVPGEGQVWQPDVASTDVGFDPYGNGAWVWYGGTGYVWASGYSWGWTPYRCGNWSYYNGFGWGWAPAAGCGGSGWGFVHGGAPVNIGRFPTGYHPIRVPTPRPGPLRPILPVRPFSVKGQMVAVQRGPRMIDGQAVSRIARAPAMAGVPVRGSSLRRDFPINPANHSHELGLASAAPAVVHSQPSSSAGQRVYDGQPASQSGYGNRGQSYPPSGGNRPQPTSHPVAPPQPASQPNTPVRTAPLTGTQYQPGQRNGQPQTQPPAQAPVAPQQRYEPRPPAEHPTYTPPPQPQRSAPPPEPSHPSYSPSPSPPPQPRTESEPPRSQATPSQPGPSPK